MRGCLKQQKFIVSVLEAGCPQGWFPLRPLSLACRIRWLVLADGIAVTLIAQYNNEIIKLDFFRESEPKGDKSEFCFVFFFNANGHFFFFFFLMAVLGLRFCARALSSCGKWGPLLIAVRGPLTIVASPVAEHRLQTRRLSNCGPRD